MKSNLKKAFSSLLAFTLVFTLSFPAHAQSFESKVTALSRSGIDLTLTSEIEQSKDIQSEFMSKPSMSKNSLSAASDSYVKEFANPKKVGSKYIPAGGVCTSVSIIGEATYIEYIFNDVNYIVAYFNNGTVEKTARTIDGHDVYTVDTNSSNIQQLNINDITSTIQISDEEADRRLQQMVDEKWPDNSVYPIEGTESVQLLAAKGSTKTVRPKKYTEDANTKPYKAKQVLTGKVTIPAFSGKKYATSQPFKVYETMSYHTEISKTTQSFKIASAVSSIASAFKVTTTTALGWLKKAGILLNAANKLKEGCDIVDDNSYKFLGGKECGIYDPTREKKYVETYQVWGQGKISVSWEYDSTGYKSPRWGHTARSSALQVSNATIRNEGRNAYNSNIQNEGVWKWFRILTMSNPRKSKRKNVLLSDYAFSLLLPVLALFPIIYTSNIRN